MHERSLCEQLIHTALQHAQGQAIAQINVTLGELAAVDQTSLQFWFDVISKSLSDSPITLNIETQAGTAFCNQCTQSFTLHTLPTPCPRCGEYAIDIQSGFELNLHSIQTKKL